MILAVLPAALLLTLGASAAPPQTPDAAPPEWDGGEPQLPGVEVSHDASLPSISLPDAVKRALERNPTLATALDELTRAEALVEEARAGWMPTLSGNATYTRLDSSRVFGGVVSQHINEFNLNANLAVPLFVPKAWQQWIVSKETVAQTGATAADVRRQVAVATGRACLNIALQHRVLEAAVRAVSADDAHRDYAQSRFQGGVGNKIDLVRAESQLASDRSLVEADRSNLYRSQEALGVLLASDVAMDVVRPEVPSPPELQKALDQVSDKRQDLVALREREHISQQLVDYHWADFVPIISASFEPFYQNPPILPTLPQTGWQAVALLTWPIYDGGLRYGQQKERVALLDESRLSTQNATRQATSDIRAAFQSVQHADASLIAAREAAAKAHQTLDLSSLAYRAGAATNIEVIDALRAALDADTTAAVAEDTSREARLDLLSASGQFP